MTLREVKSIVQNHMTGTWYLNPSVISGTLNWNYIINFKIGIIKCGIAVRIKRNTVCKHCKGNRAWCRWLSLLFKTIFTCIWSGIPSCVRGAQSPLGWIENLSVALADWGCIECHKNSMTATCSLQLQLAVEHLRHGWSTLRYAVSAKRTPDLEGSGWKWPVSCCCRAVAQSCLTLWCHGRRRTRLPWPSLSPWIC